VVKKKNSATLPTKKYNLTFKMAGFKDADIRKKKEINRRKRYYY